MEINKFRETRLRFLSRSVVITLSALILLQLLVYLKTQSFLPLPEASDRIINSISLIIASMFLVSLFLRLTLKRVYNFFIEPEERIFYSKIYSWSIYMVGLLFILYHFGVSLGNITIFIGLIATGIAFAIRDLLMSFFGWIVLLRKQPFRIGDYIRIGNDEGRVLHIGTFYVLLSEGHPLSESYIRVPNRLFLEKSIFDLGKKIYQERIIFRLSSLPENKDEVISDLKSGVLELIENKIYCEVFIDIKDEKLLLQIEYFVNFNEARLMRDRVITLTVQKMKDWIIFPEI